MDVLQNAHVVSMKVAYGEPTQPVDEGWELCLAVVPLLRQPSSVAALCSRISGISNIQYISRISIISRISNIQYVSKIFNMSELGGCYQAISFNIK